MIVIHKKQILKMLKMIYHKQLSLKLELKNSTYNIREIYFNTKYGESAVAKLKDEESLEMVYVYLPKSFMREIEINRKLHRNYYNEKLIFEELRIKDNIKTINMNTHTHY